MSLSTALAITTEVASAVGSFKNARQTTELREKSDKAAAEYLTKAKSRVEKDYYSALNVPMGAYDAALLNNLQATTTAVQALQEAGGRELLGGVGKLSAVQSAAAEQARIAQEEKMFELDKFKAENKDAMNQQMLQLEVNAEQDRVKRKQDAEEARAAFNQQGLKSLSSAAMIGLKQRNLNQTSSDDQKLKKILDAQGIDINEYAANPAKFKNKVFNVDGKMKDIKNGRVQETMVKLEKVKPSPLLTQDMSVGFTDANELETPLTNFIPSQNLGMTGSLMNPYNQPQQFDINPNMGADLNRMNYNDGIFGQPLSFQEILAKYS